MIESDFESEANVTARAVKWLCVGVVAIILLEILSYPLLAELVGRVILGQDEGLGPGLLAVQIFRVLPVGLAFLALAVTVVLVVGRGWPRLLWLVLVCLALLNVALLVSSVAEDYRQLEEARRLGQPRAERSSSVMQDVSEPSKTPARATGQRVMQIVGRHSSPELTPARIATGPGRAARACQ